VLECALFSNYWPNTYKLHIQHFKRIQLEFIEREVPSRYYSREVVLRDSVIALLNTKTKDELLSSRGKDNLRSEIKELMNEALKKALIEHVYFSEYVIR